MSKTFSLTAIALAVLTLTGEVAFGQRGRDPLGIPKPYYGRSSGGGVSGMATSPSFSRPMPRYYGQPTPLATPGAVAQADGYRTFSLEPVGIRPGDRVVVTRDDANLMLGRQVLANAPTGLEFQVTKVVNGWLGAVVNVDGQEHRGWVWHRHVQPANVPAPPSAPN